MIDELAVEQTEVVSSIRDSRITPEAGTREETGEWSRDAQAPHLRLGEGLVSANPFFFSPSTAWSVVDFGMSVSCLLAIDGWLTGFWRDLAVWNGHGGLGLSVGVALLSGALIVGSARLTGLYRSVLPPAPAVTKLLILQSVCFAVLAAFGLGKWLGWAAPSNWWIVGKIATLSGAMLASRWLWQTYRRNLKKKDIAFRNILIAGADATGREVREYLAAYTSGDYRFKGFLSTRDEADDPQCGGEIVGSIENAVTTAKSLFVDEIIFTHRPHTPGVLSATIQEARQAGVDIRLIPSLTETVVNRGDIQYIGSLPTIAILDRSHQTAPLVMKRVIDILGSLALLILLFPLFLLIAIAIKMQSRGPVLYLSKRVGYKGTVFTCFKFRTMVQDADAMKAQLAHLNERSDILFKIKCDPRVTKLGALLRKYSIDELPQLLNVMRGDMSLVGPRPSIGSEVLNYKTEHLRRLDAMPGMTGLWQVEARQDPSFETYVSLDRKYVNDWSLWLDVKILLRTMRAVISGTGV